MVYVGAEAADEGQNKGRDRYIHYKEAIASGLLISVVRPSAPTEKVRAG